MKLLVACDAWLYRTPDDKYWSPKIYNYNFFKRYLDIFEEVKVVARVEQINYVTDQYMRVDGPCIEIYGIPSFHGPRQLATRFISIQICLIHAYECCDAALFRMPSQTAQMTLWYKPKKMPYAGEIVYDPYDDAIDKTHSIPLHFIYMMISNQLKKFCLKANGVSYVTTEVIQRHYPSKARIKGKNTKKYFESTYSTITLSENSFTGSRDYTNKKTLKIVISSVSMNSERKGEKIVIKTVKMCRERGYNVSAILIGDGTLRRSFEEYANSLSVKDSITFTGLLPSADAVREIMLKCDLFMFPTRAEGLPRGILEAMAIGLPVLSTPVGGIPEIIENKYLFDPFDVDSFTNMICYLLNNPEEMTKMSKKNFNISLKFKNNVLQEKRNVFYKKLRKLVIERTDKDMR